MGLLARLALAGCFAGGTAMAACESGGCRLYSHDPVVRAAFEQSTPCPATGRRYGACPGWIADHWVPRCAGGPDTVANLWWEQRARSLRKDRAERLLCRRLRQIERNGVSRWAAAGGHSPWADFRSALLRLGGPEAARVRAGFGHLQ